MLLMLFLSVILGCASQHGVPDGVFLNSELDMKNAWIKRGWKPLQRWDFNWFLDNWNVSEIIEKRGNGRVLVHNDVFEFGYARNGGVVYSMDSLRVEVGKIYMLIASIRAKNPNSVFLGWRDPLSGKLYGKQSVKKANEWVLAYSLLSFSNASRDVVDLVFPAIALSDRTDYAFVDWVETWYFPESLPKLQKDDVVSPMPVL